MIKPNILCVDDENDNLTALDRILQKKYNILKATTAIEALEVLNHRSDIAIIISDQRMPMMTGVEFLEKSILTHPDTSKILMTGYVDIESAISAVNQGQIFRYLSKPWNITDLINTVDQAYEKYSLKIKINEKNKQLEIALAELKVLEKTKNQFMILINHELKTPLTTILSFTELLNETALSEEQQLFTNRIVRSTEKLKNIIEDVLFILKGEVGLLLVKQEMINAHWLTQNIAAEVLQSLKSKNQEIVFNSSLEAIELDPSLTQVALDRALHNATKFGLPGSIIELSVSQDVNFRTIISIKNKGPLISTKIIEKIMQPFLLDENIMNHTAGLGLGLSICNTLMKCQNAELKVNNNSDGVDVLFLFR